MKNSHWNATEPDIKTIKSSFDNPINALAQTETPAFIIRHAYNPNHCAELIERFKHFGFMKDAHRSEADKRPRIDIGTSLGNLGSNPEKFFKHAKSTHLLFKFLFDGFDNPLHCIYRNLSELCPGKNVRTARENDGSKYGPAIIRIHYDGQRYKPHIDHVVLRESRTKFSVHRFKHQFAGVLCLQNADASGPGAQSRLHQCLWTPKIQPYIETETFSDYAKENRIKNCQVKLSPGDLYFFNTQLIHEVPAIVGNQPRVVMAVFIGYSPEDDEIAVWA